MRTATLAFVALFLAVGCASTPIPQPTTPAGLVTMQNAMAVCRTQTGYYADHGGFFGIRHRRFERCVAQYAPMWSGEAPPRPPGSDTSAAP